MLVYNGTKNDFMNSVENDTIAYEIQQKLMESMNRYTAKKWIYVMGKFITIYV